MQIDVLSNVHGGVEDTGLSFKLTPPPKAAGLGGGSTPTLTPSKALLMNQARGRGGPCWHGFCSGQQKSSTSANLLLLGSLPQHTTEAPSLLRPSANPPGMLWRPGPLPQERHMNMISPLAGTSLWHADIETGKVISEWKFQKDGVDVAMKDIASKNKAAQVGPARSARVGWPSQWELHRREVLRRAGRRAGSPAAPHLLACCAPRACTPEPAAGTKQPWAPSQPPPCPQTEDTNVFLGLDTNRLARWDMRDPHGIVSEAASPIVSYEGGKDYSRGTKFRCVLAAGPLHGRGSTGGAVCGGPGAWSTSHPHSQMPACSVEACVAPTLPGIHSIFSSLFCSCMATSGDGFVVVGADDGKVRGSAHSAAPRLLACRQRSGWRCKGHLSIRRAAC